MDFRESCYTLLLKSFLNDNHVHTALFRQRKIERSLLCRPLTSFSPSVPCSPSPPPNPLPFPPPSSQPTSPTPRHLRHTLKIPRINPVCRIRRLPALRPLPNAPPLKPLKREPLPSQPAILQFIQHPAFPIPPDHTHHDHPHSIPLLCSGWKIRGGSRRRIFCEDELDKVFEDGEGVVGGGGAVEGDGGDAGLGDDDGGDEGAVDFEPDGAGDADDAEGWL